MRGRKDKIIKWSKDHKKELIITGVGVVCVAGTVVVIKNPVIIEKASGTVKHAVKSGKDTIIKKSTTTKNVPVDTEHRVWAHKLADAHEAIYDTRQSIEKCEHKLADLKTNLKFAQEEKFWFKKEDIPEIQAKIKYYEDAISAKEKNLAHYYSVRDSLFGQEPVMKPA